MVLVYPLNMLKSCVSCEVFMNEIKKIYEWQNGGFSVPDQRGLFVFSDGGYPGNARS